MTDVKASKGLILTTLLLLGLGLVQVYSSSYIYAIETLGDGQYYFKRQLLFSILGLGILFFTYKLPHKYLFAMGLLLWLFSVVGIVLTFFPGFSITAGGAARWIKLPFGQRFEPAELLKYCFPFLMALFLTTKAQMKANLKWFLFLLLTFPVFVLLLKQPDFGTFVICNLLLLVMAFCFGMKWRYILAGAAVAIPVVYFLVVRVPYRYNRIIAFLDPWADPANKGFQIIQSMLSYYSGGLWGSGLGQGKGKLFFLPEAHTDFTLSVLAEEMGFVGFLIVLFLFGFIIFKGFQITIQSHTQRRKALAVGITVAFALSSLINMGVTMGILPTKGLSLPFMSYGGSSLACTCFAIGILLNLDKQNRLQGIRNNFSGIKI